MFFLNNDDVKQVLTMEDTLRVLEDGHLELANQQLVARPRVDIYTQTDQEGFFHRWGTMEGASRGLHRQAIRMKSDIVSWREHGDGRVEDKYCVQPGLFCGLVFLFDTNNGEPLALINEGYLQHLRVGALAALSTKYLARSDAATVGMLGCGGMAHSHLLGFAAVRAIKQIKVYSPTVAHREDFAKEMSELLDIEVIPCNSVEEAVRGVDVLSACTNSVRPVVFASMLEPGMHLSQVAGEFAPDVLPRIDVGIGGDPESQIVGGIAVDDSAGIPTYLAGDAAALNRAMGPGGRQSRHAEPGDVDSKTRIPRGFQGRAVPLVDLIAGTAEGRRTDQEISASNGVGHGGGKQGLQFVTVASLVYDKAREAGLGRELPTEWFLQDIRN